MIGITSYGAYIPRLRLERMAIFQAMGWFAPALMMVAQGERSMCNWDEDAITMAVAASRDCLRGQDKQNLDALYLASTTQPFADRQNAGIVSSALNLKDNLITADYTSSQKASTTAMITALEAVKSGDRNSILVAAADRALDFCGSFGALETCQIARAWRDVRVMSIFAGTNEIMKSIAAKFMGL